MRPYDTLRSIARDMLGDSRRSGEILDLNRGVIDDPSQLIVGQVLELPEDARTTIRRSAPMTALGRGRTVHENPLQGAAAPSLRRRGNCVTVES